MELGHWSDGKKVSEAVGCSKQKGVDSAQISSASDRGHCNEIVADGSVAL